METALYRNIKFNCTNFVKWTALIYLSPREFRSLGEFSSGKQLSLPTSVSISVGPRLTPSIEIDYGTTSSTHLFN